jgi:hypothetical protein
MLSRRIQASASDFVICCARRQPPPDRGCSERATPDPMSFAVLLAPEPIDAHRR